MTNGGLKVILAPMRKNRHYTKGNVKLVTSHPRSLVQIAPPENQKSSAWRNAADRLMAEKEPKARHLNETETLEDPKTNRRAAASSHTLMYGIPTDSLAHGKLNAASVQSEMGNGFHLWKELFSL